MGKTLNKEQRAVEQKRDISKGRQLSGRAYIQGYIFSPNRPTGLIRSSSRNVRFFVCLSPSQRADAFYKSICPSVCLCVCVFVSVFTFEVPFKSLFAPTCWRWMCNIFRDSESLGKVVERSGLRFEHFCLEVVKNSPKNKINMADFALQNRVETRL